MVDLKQVIEEVLSFMGKEAETRNIYIEVNISEDLPPFESDRGKLQQIFLNVINNALSSMNVLETTIAISSTERQLISMIVFCRRLNPLNSPLLAVTTAVLMFSSPAALFWGQRTRRLYQL